MELVNETYKFELIEGGNNKDDVFVLREALEIIIRLLAPITPHFAEELWQEMGHEESLYMMPWPKYEVALLKEDEKLIVVQVNGKLRDKLTVPASIDDEELKEKALSLPKIKDRICEKEVVKVIAVPGKLVNIVVK